MRNLVTRVDNLPVQAPVPDRSMGAGSLFFRRLLNWPNSCALSVSCISETGGRARGQARRCTVPGARIRPITLNSGSFAGLGRLSQLLKRPLMPSISLALLFEKQNISFCSLNGAVTSGGPGQTMFPVITRSFEEAVNAKSHPERQNQEGSRAGARAVPDPSGDRHGPRALRGRPPEASAELRESSARSA